MMDKGRKNTQVHKEPSIVEVGMERGCLGAVLLQDKVILSPFGGQIDGKNTILLESGRRKSISEQINYAREDGLVLVVPPELQRDFAAVIRGKGTAFVISPALREDFKKALQEVSTSKPIRDKKFVGRNGYYFSSLTR